MTTIRSFAVHVRFSSQCDAPVFPLAQHSIQPPALQASSDYDKLSEGFACAAAEITGCITTVRKEVLQYKDGIRVQYLVLRLYCQISFLIHAVKWYTGRKPE